MPSIECENILNGESEESSVSRKSPSKIPLLSKNSINGTTSNKSIKIKNYKNMANSFSEDSFLNGISFDAKVSFCFFHFELAFVSLFFLSILAL